MTADTTAVDPCPHVCAACGGCPDCCPERHKTTTGDVLFIDEEIPAILGASSGHGKSNIIAARLAELVSQGRLNGDPRHDPHPIADGGSCAACEVQAVKDAALLRHSMKRDREAGVLIVDTKAENWALNWKAIAGQTAPDDQPNP